jgi:hypothetical protein
MHTVETTNIVETTPATETAMKTAKPAKKAAKKTAKPAKKAVKPAKKGAKKAVKPAKKAVKVAAAPRKSSMFKLTKGAKATGEGQRAQIVDVLRATKGATRMQVSEALPSVKLANISWHLSMLVRDGLAVRA